MAEKKLTYLISASENATPVIDKVAARFEKLKAAAAGGAGEKGNVLESLKEAFGRGSAFQESAELLKGGGVILGLTVGAEVLKNWSENAVEFKNAMSDANANVGELVDKMIGSVPVVGGFWQAGRNIREFFTGEQAAANETLRDAAVQDHLTAIKKGMSDEQGRTLGEFADARKKSQQGGDLIGLNGPDLLEKIAEQKFTNASDSLQKLFDEGLKNQLDSAAEAKKVLQATRKLVEVPALVQPSTYLTNRGYSINSPGNAAEVATASAAAQAEQTEYNTKLKAIDDAVDNYTTKAIKANAFSIMDAKTEEEKSIANSEEIRKKLHEKSQQDLRNSLSRWFTSAGAPAGSLAGGVYSFFAGLANRPDALPAVISNQLPTLKEGNGSGAAEFARDTLTLQAADERRERARLEKKRTDEAERTRKAAEDIATTIKNFGTNTIVPLFVPR